MLGGNLFLERLSQVLDERALLPEDSAFRRLPKGVTLKYLAIQASMLSLIWFMKQHKQLALFFPGCVALLMLTRHKLVPRLFSKEQIAILDPED